MIGGVGLAIGIVVTTLAVVGCTAAGEAPAGMASSRPSPTPDLRPVLRYPDGESHGTLAVAFETPKVLTMTVHLTCQWTSPTLVESFYAEPTSPLVGELVTFYISPQNPYGDAFGIGRDGAATYMPSPTTGSTTVARHAADWASGSIVFADLAPDPNSAGAGPLPSPLTDWVRPIGGDPAWASVSGTATWACDPAPPTVPTPAPEVSQAPERTIPPLPALALVVGDRRELGLDGCGASINVDGWQGADSCGPSFQAPGSEHIVRIRAGDDLRFELPTGWRFTQWSVGWVSTAEAVRWRSEQPDTFRHVHEGAATDGSVLEVAAPPAGDWTVRVDWTGARGADSIQWPDYFRVVVAD